MIRNLYELALKAGRRHQSDQTHWIHWNAHVAPEGPHHTIPTVYNFLFILALFRSRIADNLTEGKNLLSQLLAFQHEQGNFPLSLDQYPTCHDRNVAVQLLPIFFWIDREFLTIMNPELKQPFRTAQDRLHAFAIQQQQDRPFPYPMNLVVAASTKEPSLASLLNDSHEQQEWWETGPMAWLLVALQMTGADWEKGEWSPFWDHLGQSWHPKLFAYTGPAFREWQEGAEPKAGFYDLWMGLFQGELSRRALVPSIDHLWASLLRPVATSCPFLSQPHTLEGQWDYGAWRALSEPSYSCAFIERRTPLPPSSGKGFAAFRTLWGDDEHLHSLVCQGNRNDSITWKKGEGRGDLLFQLSKEVDVEDKKKNREVMFYVDQDPDIRILVEDKYATTFSLEQKVTVQSKDRKFHLVFALEEGTGDFLGHIMPGNRPSQTTSGTSQAYDWQIFLRTLRRSDDCRIRVSITYS